MLIYLKDSYQLITTSEGSEDDLSETDIAEGFMYCLKTKVYEQLKDSIYAVESGRILSRKDFSEMDTEEVIDRILDYWEVEGDEYIILDY